ncbi:endonuclease/exonuclease/phosphatase family protein [Marinomonas pollencensis]|uniref:Endonuclease/exonuclease/phosphatase domain-containing protein n=1 Tax=Marinomonas pollencensis TaxID=491954 RepID=A0A3E0DXB1_9GAMM|nr:endonuclease/exonuclease/phosphatase family protein [Marinomonas pollencensis]REG86731.1 hypothetical protein DFP81_101296 [Marinomonas pollencensis]
MLLYKLRFAWWNTGLSPASNKAETKATPETSKRNYDHIVRLFLDYECDFLALCEVSEEDVTYIKNNLDLENVGVASLVDNIPRTRFDVCVMYNAKKIKIQEHTNLIKPYMGSRIKSGQVLHIENIDDKEVFRIYLCHWSSRMQDSGSENRKFAAQHIYDSIQSYFIENGIKEVVVMGDFNDNPYDESLMKTLRASRCLDSVKKHPIDLLYNPFWKTVVSSIEYSHSNSSGKFSSGTYNYQTKEGVRWHSFDQIILSGCFLGHSKWHLNESNTTVIDDCEFKMDFDKKDCHIDHMPVIAEILRV